MIGISILTIHPADSSPKASYIPFEQAHLGNLGINPITLFRRLQEIAWNLCRQLVLLSVATNGLEVFALVLRVKVDKCLRAVRIQPDLAKHTGIDGAHQLLAEDIQAMC